MFDRCSIEFRCKKGVEKHCFSKVGLGLGWLRYDPHGGVSSSPVPSAGWGWVELGLGLGWLRYDPHGGCRLPPFRPLGWVGLGWVGVGVGAWVGSVATRTGGVSSPPVPPVRLGWVGSHFGSHGSRSCLRLGSSWDWECGSHGSLSCLGLGSSWDWGCGSHGSLQPRRS